VTHPYFMPGSMAAYSLHGLAQVYDLAAGPGRLRNVAGGAHLRGPPRPHPAATEPPAEVAPGSIVQDVFFCLPPRN
jgi:hypothetical protein